MDCIVRIFPLGWGFRLNQLTERIPPITETYVCQELLLSRITWEGRGGDYIGRHIHN